MIAMINTLHKTLHRIPEWLIALVARVAVAVPFWLSGRTKTSGWDFWNVTDQTKFLFQYEYGFTPLGVDVTASLASIAEHVFPVLLVLGLATRLSAIALFGMTLVIQIFVYPSAWSTHLLWSMPLLYLIARGGGAISLDRIIGIDSQK